MTGPSYGVRELANWILDYADEQGVRLSNMSLNKLLYFAYEAALLQYNRRLTGAKIEAWEHGPVFREVYRSFKEFGDRPITKRASKYDPATGDIRIASRSLSASDESIVKEAIAPLINFSASVLRDLSHASDGPWAATWYHEDVTNPGMEISDEVIRRCYVSRDATA